MSAHALPATVAIAAKSVIVADDTAFVRDRFRVALESSGHHVIPVSNASDLIVQVRQRKPIDLVALDLRLPRGGGVSLVRALRRIDGFQAPIVIFSGTIAHADEVRALGTLGVDGYVNEYSAVQHIVPALTSYLVPDHDHRRESPRVALGVSVSYRIGNLIASAVTLSVSAGGLAVRTTSPPRSDEPIKVRFRLPGASKDVEAETRLAWTDRQTGMGLRFTRIEPRDQAIVDGFVRARFFSNRKA
jgi:CheY-like chemotaxis protein